MLNAMHTVSRDAFVAEELTISQSYLVAYRSVAGHGNHSGYSGGLKPGLPLSEVFSPCTDQSRGGLK